MGNEAATFSFLEKVILVIGGSGKVGAPLVNSLLDCGSTVISVSRNNQDNEQGARIKEHNKIGKLLEFGCDVSTEKGIESLKFFLKKQKLSPNVLINALSYRPLDLYLSNSIHKWDEIVSKNSRSMYMIFREFAELMSENDGGSVINISTIYAVVAPDPAIYVGLDMGTEADYPFIKGGGLSLTRYFASYYADRGVRFNSIILGGVFNNQDPRFIERYIAKVPLGRMAKANDIFGLVHLLASDASSYITGAEIPVDGGYLLR